MVQPESSADPATVVLWLRQAEQRATRCFICRSIVTMNRSSRGELGPITILGFEIGPESQMRHLAQCEQGSGIEP